MLLRGGVFIGVNRTTGGGLPTLHAAAAGAQLMHRWATDPDGGAMSPDCTRLLTDSQTDSTVTVDDVTDAVQAVIDCGVDQLILYFSGHGLIVNNVETWLLSKAPRLGSAAISVWLSVLQARKGRTPHVVIVSDACRTPTKDLQSQGISGSSAFPSPAVPALWNRVDVFYASAPGQAAIELDTVSGQGIYTDVLHATLTGAEPRLFQRTVPPDGYGYLWSGPLGAYLENAVAERLIQLGIDQDQAPICEVQWGPKNLHWLARRPAAVDYDWPSMGEQRVGITTRDSYPGLLPPGAPEETMTVSQLAGQLLETALATDTEGFAAALDGAGQAPAPGARGFVALVRKLIEPFDPQLLDDSATVVRVRGGRIVTVQSPADLRARAATGHRVVSHGKPRFPSSSVLIEFENETFTALPILHGYVTEVTLREREIVAVTFARKVRQEQSGFSSDQLRQARSVVAVAARHGRFGPAEDALARLGEPHLRPQVDPTITLYAAYAHHIAEADRETLIALASAQVQSETALFDVHMLAGLISSQGMFMALRGPYFPLLTQGWELLDEYGGLLGLRQLKDHLLPSLWTLFDVRARTLVHKTDLWLAY